MSGFAGFCQPGGKTNTIEHNGKQCTHQVAFPPGADGSQAPPPAVKELAKNYAFEIDPFQRTAAYALEAGDSVLVAAHTSAGKTVIAEYAIAMALRDKTRVIYTSPLKALSNQKYKEFAEEFGDVGLMTGDITINPNASCLVMTTEILRSMLYHGSEIVREVHFLVYDEIHYIKDKERGVVWEESIILLPDQCQYAFLSATIPNAFEFAQWIANTHNKKCHVVYTDYRPTPLQHFIMPTGGSKAALYCVVDPQGKFKEENFQKAMAAAGDADGGAGKSGKGSTKKNTDQGKDSEIFQLVKLLMERNLEPVIVFALSKTQCEDLAGKLESLQLNDADEEKLVERIFDAATACLSDADKNLAQVQRAKPMLKRGIGVHHSGLLPIVKEVIEILFGEGLIKVLFATETFSTGLNMPARTVCFAGVRKFDGVAFRNLTGGEFIQMSGRAGRRGLDALGTVVLMCDQRLEPAVAKDVVRGAPDPLRSAFRLSYTMLLSILRLDVAEMKPELLITRSLRQHQTQAALPKLRERLAKVEHAYESVAVPHVHEAEALYLLLREREKFASRIQQIVSSPEHAVPFLQYGRLVRVLLPKVDILDLEQSEPEVSGRLNALPEPPSDADLPTGAAPAVWAVVVSFQRLSPKDATRESKPQDVLPPDTLGEALQSSYVVDVLARTRRNYAPDGRPVTRHLLPHDAEDSQALVVRIPLDQVAELGAPRVHLPDDLRTDKKREQGLKTASEAIKRLTESYKKVPLLDPLNDLKIKSSAYKKTRLKLDRNETNMNKISLYGNSEYRECLRAYAHKENLRRLVELHRADIKEAESMILKDDLRRRLRVLQRLGYIEESGVVNIKGHVAAGVSSGDCLVLTELLFDGTLSGLKPIQLASLLSCCVWSTSSERKGVKLDGWQENAFNALRQAVKHVGEAEEEVGLKRDVEAYKRSFSPDIMKLVEHWANGVNFKNIIDQAKSIYEGSLVRALRKLHELMLQMKGACDTLGDTDLASNFEEAAAKLHRDVVFAASLYL